VRLGVSSETVGDHMGSILRKLESRSRTEAAVKAIKRRLLGVGVAAVLVGMIAVNSWDTGALNQGHAPGNVLQKVECPGIHGHG
jgi:hypothetical protein